MLLTPEILIQAYASGAFPMADPEEDNQIYWHTPQMRGVIPLDDRFKVSKNLKRLYKKDKFDLYINRNFDQVIDYCRSLREDDTWISDEILDAYKQLHEGGFAHSFEVYEEGKLVGGLYGVSIGKAFFGESMFHLVTDASKIALVFLVEFLREHDFLLLDTQYLNPHIAQFGAYEITHQEYVKLLRRAIAAS
ncbi:MAG: leucyl/phenylalanyl-tRNA--protein transferase [Bacteroidia bacterium]